MIDSCIVAIFLIGTLIYGIVRGRGVKTLLDYSVGNRIITRLALTTTIAATIIGGGSTIGNSSLIYTIGIIILVGSVCECLKFVVVAEWIVPKLANKDCITIGDFIGSYYGSPGRVVTGLAGSVACAASIGGQIAAVGYVTHYFLGVSPTTGILIAFGSLVVYSSFGGFRSVVATDMIQFFVLAISFPMVALVAVKMAGGFEYIWHTIPKEQLSFFPSKDIVLKYGLIYLSFIIPDFYPTVTQRIFASDDVKRLKKSFILSGLMLIPLGIIMMLIGLSAVILLPNIEPHTVLMALIDTILPVGFKGLAICGLLAVIISTADSLLNSGAILLVHDVFKPLSVKKMTNNQELRLVRLLTFLVGILAMVIAIHYKVIFDMIRFGNIIWAPLVVVPILCLIIGIIPSKKAYVIASSTTLGFICLWLYFQGTLIIEPLFPGLIFNGLMLLLIDRKNLIKVSNKVVSTTTSKIIKIPNRASLIDFLRLRAESRKPPYTIWGFVVGCFIIISYMHLSLIPPDIILIYTYFLPVIIGASLCFVLIFSDIKWNNQLTYLKPIIWFIALTVCLPFLSSVYFLIKGCNVASIVNVAISFIFFLVVSDWLLALILYPLGIICAYIYSLLFLQEFLLADINDFFVLSLGLTILSSVISLAFLRTQAKLEKVRTATLVAISGAIAHELRTPLSIMRNANNLSIEEIKKAKDSLSSHPLTREQCIQILNSLQYNTSLINEENVNANSVIDMHLEKIKKPYHGSFSNISAKELVQKSMDEYYFDPDEKVMVQCIQDKDFLIKGDEISLKHVFFNLFKNAVYYVKKSGKKNLIGAITITLNPCSFYNKIHFKDYGMGIVEEDIPLLFEKFYSKTKYGTGLGLYYCKSTMQAIGGNIECYSEPGTYTEFVLTFPKVE